MAIVFHIFHTVKKRVGENWAGVLFICFWLTFEFLHHDWDLSWPWLTLGNAFADTPSWIQWYEFTGIFGGSFWVLVVNVLVFYFFQNSEKLTNTLRIRNAVYIIVIILFPILISFYCCGWDGKKDKELNVTVIQPNIDPYNVKFYMAGPEQVEKMLDQAAKAVTQETDYMLLPETALTEDIWENRMESSESIQMIRSFLQRFPKLKIVTGASTLVSYAPGQELSATARKFDDSDGYYDYYNTALQIDHSDRIQVYHKSKLVPGVEKMPFPWLFKYFEKFAIEMGGTSGSLGMQEERTVFTSDVAATAPVVCYESIYGEYVSEYIRNGANFISIITNDGWWGDTPGYKQHLKYGALRAIETRKWIARSANTGISCFIDPNGNILQPTNWWVPAAVSQKIGITSTETFYTRHGDCLARAALYISIAMLIYSLLIRFRLTKKW
jgi:apolipoprotein N-acyltransferase